MKTNRLKIKSTLFISFLILAHNAWASETFECVRDLMTVTDRANLSTKRVGVESPVLIHNKYIVFPEVKKGVLSGFYIYSATGAKYYDAVQIKTVDVPITKLKFRLRDGIYDLVAQPEGLETVIIPYLPGFRYVADQGGGPVVLGSSILPVIGAFVSRPEGIVSQYYNPDSVNESDVQRWMAEKAGVRSPASVDKLEIKRTLIHLASVTEKNEKILFKPLEDELRLRKAWIQKSNLDEKTFKQFNLVIEGSCKQ